VTLISSFGTSRFSQFQRLGIWLRESQPRPIFVILSLHGKAGLPTEIRGWIETWARLIADSNTALIALVDKPKTSDGTAAFTVAYLRSVANRAEIDFFIHTFFGRSTN
jgi:hypothetical protein